MKLSWLWWYKHFHFVYLFASVLFLGSIASSTLAGDEPTEEPEESNGNVSISTGANSTAPSSVPPSTTEGVGVDDIDGSSASATNISDATETVHVSLEDFPIPKQMNGNGNPNPSERHEQYEARALFHSPGNAWNWKTAEKMVSRGFRMFRESLLEGAKVAHMFKEDFDEGMSSFVRQNRGVKVDSGQSNQKQNEYADSGSIFDSQMLREGVLGGILRFMGINSKQMGVIALNVLIIFAERITSSMIGGSETAGATSRMIKSNLLQWANTGHIFQVEKIITQAKSHSLPETLIDTLSEKTGNSTSCVQLFLCKMMPVIWGFQDTVKDQLDVFGFHQELTLRTATPSSTTTTSSPTENSSFGESRGILGTTQYLLDTFLGHLPPTDKMVDFGDRCEAKFPHCQLLNFKTTH